MQSRTRRARRRARSTLAAVAAAFAIAFAPGLHAFAFAAGVGDPARPAEARRPFPRRDVAADRGSGRAGRAEGPGGWWLGTAGVALALAVCGWASVAARRYLPRAGAAGPAAMRVVGRTSLSPRHTVYLLEVGGRVLIVGAGPQGPPTLLGELADPDDLELDRARDEAAPRPARFDRSLGDDA